MKKALPLVKDLWASFGVATQRSLDWDDLVGRADDMKERCSDKYRMGSKSPAFMPTQWEVLLGLMGLLGNYIRRVWPHMGLYSVSL